jgi:hypothetical protein
MVRIDPSKELSEGETLTDNGLALSPAMAAMCAADSARTVVFIRGLHAAIQNDRNRSLGRPTRVLYAGCGPYATLAVPLMALFPPQELTFTVLDIHERSIESAKAVVNALGLEESVTSYEVVDALCYQVRPDQPPDIIVLEIMNACLEKEPQVAITRHLIDQAPQATLVPTLVRVDANLVDPAKEFSHPPQRVPTPDRDRLRVGTVFELSAETVKQWKRESTTRLPVATLRLPNVFEERFSLMFFTTIQVYKEHRLREYDTGLTAGRIAPVDGRITGGDAVSFYYRLGHHPALVCDSVRHPGRTSEE